MATFSLNGIFKKWVYEKHIQQISQRFNMRVVSANSRAESP